MAGHQNSTNEAGYRKDFGGHPEQRHAAYVKGVLFAKAQTRTTKQNPLYLYAETMKPFGT